MNETHEGTFGHAHNPIWVRGFVDMVAQPMGTCLPLLSDWMTLRAHLLLRSRFVVHNSYHYPVSGNTVCSRNKTIHCVHPEHDRLPCCTHKLSRRSDPAPDNVCVWACYAISYTAILPQGQP
jgi:hypothetical protein